MWSKNCWHLTQHNHREAHILKSIAPKVQNLKTLVQTWIFCKILTTVTAEACGTFVSAKPDLFYTYYNCLCFNQDSAIMIYYRFQRNVLYLFYFIAFLHWIISYTIRLTIQYWWVSARKRFAVGAKIPTPEVEGFLPPPQTEWGVNCAIPTAHVVLVLSHTLFA